MIPHSSGIYRIIGSIAGIAIIFLFSYGCNNPFAPRLSDNQQSGGSLGDQREAEGVFQTFRYAYLYKDTLAYGKLLAPDFTFIYRNYDKGVDASWGRDEDMLSTAGLFNAAQSLDLVWNDIVITAGDSVLQDISRGFNLTITFSPQDIVRLQGRVNLRLRRQAPGQIWQITRWRDESNY
jgi:hypothetical protein